MKFKIIEQKTRNTQDIYPVFKELYLNPKTSVADIKKELNLSNSEYKHLRKQIQRETGIDVKPNPYNKLGVHNTNPNLYIHHRKNRYEIRKGRKYYGRFKTLEEARAYRDKLQENNWETI